MLSPRVVSVSVPVTMTITTMIVIMVVLSVIMMIIVMRVRHVRVDNVWILVSTTVSLMLSVESGITKLNVIVLMTLHIHQIQAVPLKVKPCFR